MPEPRWGIARHVFCEEEGRWYTIREDPRQPAIVHVQPQSGAGARSKPIIVSSVEAALDWVAKQGKGKA